MDISALIESAAKLAAQSSAPGVPQIILDYFGTHLRPDGLYAVSDQVVEMYFPASELAAARTEQIERYGYSLESLPARERPASAFRQFNSTIAQALAEATAEKAGLDRQGVNRASLAALSAARIKINAAIESGNIY